MAPLLLFGLIPFLITSLTGGIAGAIVGRGQEDRSILANAAIGLVGWAAALLLVSVWNGASPEELTFGHGFLALACAVGFVHLLDRRAKKTAAGGEPETTLPASQ